MTHTISNNQLTASVKTMGAELTSLRTSDNHEYLWQPDPETWAKQSPVLFPIIGGIPDNRYRHGGQEYTMGGHGFAGKMEWSLLNQSKEELVFRLESNPDTRTQYPFDFVFLMRYSIVGKSLTIGYDIQNTGKYEMYFSVGGHPGFACPLEDGLEFTDYRLHFSHAESALRHLKEGGLLTGETEPFVLPQGILPLNHEMFSRDAYILRGLSSDSVTLESERGSRSVTVDFEKFPDLGIWSYKARPGKFVCIEPWYGVDSTVGDVRDLSKKSGILSLDSGERFQADFSITLD